MISMAASERVCANEADYNRRKALGAAPAAYSK